MTRARGLRSGQVAYDFPFARRIRLRCGCTLTRFLAEGFQAFASYASRAAFLIRRPGDAGLVSRQAETFFKLALSSLERVEESLAGRPRGS